MPKGSADSTKGTITASKTFREGAIYLYQRSDFKKPTWLCRIKVPNTKGYVTRSTGTGDEHQAFKFADDLYNQLLVKSLTGETVVGKRIGPAIDAYILRIEPEKDRLSIRYKILLMKRIKTHWARKMFEDLSPAMISKLVDKLIETAREGRLSPNTIKRIYSDLKHFFQWCLDEGYLEKMPRFPRASGEAARRPHFDPRDWQKLTRHLREFVKIENKAVKRDRMMLREYVLIMANTGIRSEIALYIAMGEEEKSAHDAVIEKHAKKSSAAMSARNSRRLGAKMAAEINRASSLIDEKLALKFALYSDDIAHNGYAFQAHLLETKVLGSVIKKAELARASYEKIKSAWLEIVDPFPLNFKKWNWKEMSKHVGMGEEYDFLYSYTSRLLHASPHSLTTDQKNLEDSEVLMFMKYIEQQIKWTMGYVDEVLGRRSIH